MNINTITAYLLVSNTDAVELKLDYALLGVSPDKCVYHFENIRNSERFDIYLNNYSF